MTRNRIIAYIDTAIRFLLYVFIFWLPYSNAVVESCVVAAFILWIIKRILLINWNPAGRGWKEYLLGIVRGVQPAPSPINIPVAVFLGVCFISLILSGYKELAVTGFWLKLFEWFLIIFLFCEVFQEKRHIRIALFVFILTAASTIIDSMLQYYAFGKDIFNGRPLIYGGVTASFNHPNSLGGYLTLVIPLFFAYSLFLKEKSLKFVWAFILGAAWWSMFLTFSRAAWLAALIGILAVLIIQKKRKKPTFFIILLITMVSVTAIFVSVYHRNSSLDLWNKQGNSWAYRKNLAQASIEMTKDKPLFGHGPNTYMSLLGEYQRELFLVHMGPSYAHNCYLQMAAEVGVIGLSCFLWFIYSFYKNAIFDLKNLMEEGEFLRISHIGLLGGATAFLFHSFFDTNLYSLRLSLIFWSAVGLIVCMGSLKSKCGISNSVS